jgi:5-methylcytosine-specific restriction endonuclease McrA
VAEPNSGAPCAPDADEKRCSICKQMLQLDQFTRDRRAKDGLDGRCRTCKSAAYAKWAAKQDPDELREGWRTYYVVNRECRRASATARYRANPEADRLRARARRQADLEHARAIDRRSYHRNAQRRAEAIRQNRQRWFAANREQLRERRRAAYVADPEPFREAVRRRDARKRAATVVPFTPAQLAVKLALYGGCCRWCGRPATCWDHVKPLAKGGPHMLANLTPACTRCNQAKSHRWPLSSWLVVLDGLVEQDLAAVA